MELVEFKNGHVNTVHEHIANESKRVSKYNHDIPKDKGDTYKISTDLL